MTLHEVAEQLYSISMFGYIDDEKHSKTGFINYVVSKVRKSKKIENKTVFRIALLDRWWYMTIGRHKNEYDYYIPDTKQYEENSFCRLH